MKTTKNRLTVYNRIPNPDKKWWQFWKDDIIKENFGYIYYEPIKKKKKKKK